MVRPFYMIVAELLIAIQHTRYSIVIPRKPLRFYAEKIPAARIRRPDPGRL